MSSISGGFKMSNMAGDSNGNQNFFMGGEQPKEEEKPEQEPESKENSALAIADPLTVAEATHARQYWEKFIADNNSLSHSYSPWQVPPQQNLRERGRKDVIVTSARPKSRNPFDQFSVNA